MAAAPGNQYAAKAKRWTQAIDDALAQMDKSRVDGLRTLNELAKALIQKAEEGDMAALKEIGDRLEGKPKQQMELSSDPESPLTVQIVRFDGK